MQNYTAVTLERVQGRVMKRVRFYNRHGVCTRSKLVPYSYDSKDWTKIPTSRRFRAYGEKCTVARGAVVDAFLARAPLPQDNTAIYVNHVAKRDWLISQGYLNGPSIHRLEWIPGDEVIAVDDETGDERVIECPSDAADNQSIAIRGGYFHDFGFSSKGEW